MSNNVYIGKPFRMPNQDAEHEAFLAERALRDTSSMADPRPSSEKQSDQNWKPVLAKLPQPHEHDARIAALEKQVKNDRSEEEFRALKTEAEKALFHLKEERNAALAIEDAKAERRTYLQSIAPDLAKFDAAERRMLLDKENYDLRDLENLRKGREQLLAGPEFDRDVAFDFLAKVAAKEKTVTTAKRQDLLGKRKALEAEIAKVSGGLEIDAEAEPEGESEFDRKVREWKYKDRLIKEAVAENRIGDAYRLLGAVPPEAEPEAAEPEAEVEDE